jgi:flavin reductase (DIM6/NTAB) family NADH-FMN oxidoreductase RutF
VELDKAYRLLSPRLVVLITTKGRDGTIDVAPFSFAGPLSFDEPLVYFAVGRGGKTTERNVREIPEFVMNVVGEEFAEQAVKCERKPEDGDKFKAYGLHTVKSKEVSVPGVQECKIRLECKVKDIIDIKGSDHLLVVGRVVHAHCEELAGDMPVLDKIKPLMHVSGGEFRKLGERMFVKRVR